MRMHRITTELMTDLGYSSKLNGERDFLWMLRAEGRRAANAFLEQHGKHEDGGGLSRQPRPLNKKLRVDVARQPEQSDLGEEVIDEQASDHQLENRVLDLKTFQQAGSKCHGAGEKDPVGLQHAAGTIARSRGSRREQDDTQHGCEEDGHKPGDDQCYAYHGK